MKEMRLMLLLTFVALAIAAGYTNGGRASNISQARFRFGSLIIIALTAKIILFVLGYPFVSSSPKLAITAHVFSYLLVIAFLFLNWQIDGMRIIAAGLMLNFLAVMYKGGFELTTGMYAAAAERINSPLVGLPTGDGILPVFKDAFSLGSMLMGFGIFAAVSRLMQPHKAQTQAVNASCEPRHRYRPKHLAKPRKWSMVLVRKAG